MSFFLELAIILEFSAIHPVLILLDPDPISLGTFSPPPGMELATWAGADVDDGPETAGDPPEKWINLFLELPIYARYIDVIRYVMIQGLGICI